MGSAAGHGLGYSAPNKSFCRNILVQSLIDGVDVISQLDDIVIERIHVVVGL